MPQSKGGKPGNKENQLVVQEVAETQLVDLFKFYTDIKQVTHYSLIISVLLVFPQSNSGSALNEVCLLITFFWLMYESNLPL